MTVKKTRWITVEEMRDRLSISKNKAYQIASSRAIETVKIGRCLRISEESLSHWLESLRNTKAQGGDHMR
jgi:excisionase family DNA binding protein